VPNEESEKEIAALKASLASLTLKNKTMARASSDYDVYRGVVEASLARLQGDVTRVAEERDGLAKHLEEMKGLLSKERRANGALKTRCSELEYKLAAYASGSVGKGEAAAAVSALKGALEDAKVASSVSDASLGELRAAAAEEVETLQWKIEELSKALGQEVKKRVAVEEELHSARGYLLEKLVASSSGGEGGGGGGGGGISTLPPRPPVIKQRNIMLLSPDKQQHQQHTVGAIAGLVGGGGSNKASAAAAQPPPKQLPQQQPAKQTAAVGKSPSGGGTGYNKLQPQEWDGRDLVSLLGASVAAPSVSQPPVAAPPPPNQPRSLASQQGNPTPPLLADAWDEEEEKSFATALGLLGASTRPQQQPPSSLAALLPPAQPPRQSILQAFQAGEMAKEKRGGQSKQITKLPLSVPASLPRQLGKMPPPPVSYTAPMPPPTTVPPRSLEEELGLEASFELALNALRPVAKNK